MAASSQSKTSKSFQIFRKAGATLLDESSSMSYAEMSSTVAEGLQRARDAGLGDGVDVRVLFDSPGFSLVYSWFKSGFPLPLHTHNSDCLYVIMSGSLRLGVETLAAGDGFFLPAGTPYTYTPGEDGLEILEFRQQNDYDIRFLANSSAFWTRAVNAISERRPQWAEERPLSARGRSE